MDEEVPHLVLTLDLNDPIEIFDFVGLFGSIGRQYENYIHEYHPDLSAEGAKIFVHRVQEGSIIATLFPGGPGDLIRYLESILVVSGFAKLIAEDVLGYIGGNWKSGAKKSDLETIAGLVRGVANDSGGTATIETVEYREGVSSRELVLKFDTSEARTAVQILQDHKLDLDKTSAADYERVLMTFTRSDIGDASVGKRTGEWALIEEILEKPRPTNLRIRSRGAEDQIRDSRSRRQHLQESLFR